MMLERMPRDAETYPIVIEALPDEEGGGFVALVSDLPGCIADGESREEAARGVGDAVAAWIEEATALCRPVPAPSRLPGGDGPVATAR